MLQNSDGDENTVLIPVTVLSMLASEAEADEHNADLSDTFDNDPSLDYFSSSDTDSEAETSSYDVSTDSESDN